MDCLHVGILMHHGLELESTMMEMNKLKQRVKALEVNEATASAASMRNACSKMSDRLANPSDEKDEGIPSHFQDDGNHEQTGYTVDTNQSYVGCQCGAAMKLNEVIKVNHCWSRDYNKLQLDYDQLKETQQQLTQLKLQFEQVKGIAFEKAEVKKNENESVNLRNEQAVTMRNEQAVTLRNEQASNSDEVEALKQQLKIYEEDFSQEKEESKKLLIDNCTLKTNIHKANEFIKNLTAKNATLKEKYRHVYKEKEHIVKELKRLTNNSMDSMQEQCGQGTSKPHSQTSRDVMLHQARIVIPPAEQLIGRNMNNGRR